MVTQQMNAYGAVVQGYRQQYLWDSGALKPCADVNVSLTAATWSGLRTVFEGIKAYRSPSGDLNIWALGPHLRRFQDSIKFMRMESRWSSAELEQAIMDSLAANGIDGDCYIQPVATPPAPEDGLYAQPVPNVPARIYIPVAPRGSMLLTERAYRCVVTSWTRISDSNMPPRIKAVPNYQNSQIATMDAILAGFDSPIFLNDRGTVAEGPGSCIAIVRAGRVITPPVTAGILESITRDFFLRLIPEALGIPVEEREIDRTELYAADEAFFCGTGAEVRPIVSVDHHTIGSGETGPITRAVEKAYHDAVRAIDPRYAAWRTPVRRG